VVFYFLLIRPQQKKMKAHREMVQALKRGDRVVTSGGIVGTVTKVVSDSEVQIEIAENVRVRVVRSSITDIVAKTEPASNGNAKEEAAKGE
jgi:preprotein translocase subunit YajC